MSGTPRKWALALIWGLMIGTLGVTVWAEPTGMTSLMKAAYNGDLEGVARLLREGVNVNEKDREGKTALIWAAGPWPFILWRPEDIERTNKVRSDIVTLLLAKRARVGERDKKGKTPLMVAIAAGRVSVASTLIENGANPNDRDQEGNTALMMAAHKGYTELVKLLLNKGAEVNGETNKGDSAITEASFAGRADMVNLLLSHGAKPRDGISEIPIREKTGMPNYIVFSEKEEESPLKAQVELEVVVSEPTSKERLNELVNSLYSSIQAQARQGFKHHKSPSNVYISIFRTKYHAESGQAQWMVRLMKSNIDAVPQIMFKEDEIELSQRAPAKRFGLTEDKRMCIWKELASMERKARSRAEAKYPDSYNYTKPTGDSYHRKEFEKKLTDQYESRLARRHQLTRDQLDKISEEGMAKNWPAPDYDD